MKIVCTVGALRRGLAIVKPAIKESLDVPILSHVLLQAASDHMILSANNLQIGIWCNVAADIEEEGAAAIPWDRLEDLAARLPPGLVEGNQHPMAKVPIEMKTISDGGKLFVQSGRSRATICAQLSSEFPPVVGQKERRKSEEAVFTIQSAHLASMLEQVACAASTDEDASPNQSGVLLQVEGQMLTLSARDRLRLALCESSLEGTASGCMAMLPSRSAFDLSKFLSSIRSDSPLHVYLDDLRAWISFLVPGGLGFVSYLTEEPPSREIVRWHDVREFFQKPSKTRVVVKQRDFSDALKSVTQIAHDEGDFVTLKIGRGIDGRASVMEIVARSQERGEQTSEVEIASLEGEESPPLLVKLPHLIKVVTTLRSTWLAVELFTKKEPVSIKPVENEGDTHLAYALARWTLPG